MTLFKSQIYLIIALLISNALILFGNQDWLWLRLPAVIALIFVLPGWSWAAAAGWLGTREAIERGLIIFGLSLVSTSLGLLIAVMLPGPFSEVPVLITLNLVTLTGLAAALIRSKYRPFSKTPSSLIWPSNKIILILLLIMAVATITRVTRLGYAEFHEDELENMRFIVRAYKGEEHVPFIDSKGPIHWLLPAGLWYANGWVNEGIARTPFVLAALMLIPMMFALGRRISNGDDTTGLIAAAVVALNGFFASLARHVENRSLIVFLGAMAVWLAYRYYKTGRFGLLICIGLVLAVGLIAHPSTLLYLPVIAFIIIAAHWRKGLARQQLLWLATNAALFIGVIALFYIPYLTNPEIERTYEYFAGERVGTSLLYNRVGNMLDEDQIYSSRFYAPILIALLVWLLVRNFARAGRGALLILIGLGPAIVSTVLWPDIWVVGSINIAFIPYLLLTLDFIILPKTNIETKFAFIYFAAPFGVLLFMAKDISNHIQIAYPGWSLLCAFALSDLWHTLHRRAEDSPGLMWFKPKLKVAIVVILLLAIPLIVYYQYLSFGAPVTTYWQAKTDYETNPNSIYKYVYGSIYRPRRAISNPRLGGWKTVGYLWEQGLLTGDFRSINESFAVPIWYTFQTPRSCYENPQNYWIRRDRKGWPEKETELVAQGYNLTRVVLVDQQPKLHLYEKNAPAQTPEMLDINEYRHLFDRLATPARYAAGDIIETSTSFNFGDKIELTGYNLPATAQAGAVLPVTVYWQGLAPMDVRYRAFVHLVDTGGGRWGQHDDDPACRLLTTDMRAGQQASRQFQLPIASDTPPGTYRLILGLYHPDTLERLPIWDNQTQQSPGDSLELGHITITQ